MPNYISVTLPAPAGNGSGAAVDVSEFGATKTITVSGGGNTVLRPSVMVEISNQLVPTKWAPVAFFGAPDDATVVVAARWMRATVQNFRGGDAPTVKVGGYDDGTEFATLVAPAASGVGASVDTTELQAYKTIHVGGPFRGALIVEISEDSGATWNQLISFSTPGLHSQVFAADFMRVRRVGVPENTPGLPVINIGATAGPGGGGAAGDHFVFVCEGDEGDLFTIMLPDERNDTDYLVHLTMGGPAANDMKSWRILDSTKTTTTFDVEFSAEVQEGDVLYFSVFDINAETVGLPPPAIPE